MDKLEKIKPKMAKKTKEYIEMLKERKELATLIVLGVILVGLFITVIIPKTRDNIRVKQTDGLVLKVFKDNPKVEGITYNQLEATIINNKDIVVALVDQNDPLYLDFEKAITDKEKMAVYPEKVYIYPIIYNEKETKKFYKLESGITLIYFQNKKEVQRINLVDQKEIELYLVDHLNSLLRQNNAEANQAAEQAEAERLANEAAEEERQRLADEEVIDELKNSETTQE